jgi:hypothetical protein
MSIHHSLDSLVSPQKPHQSGFSLVMGPEGGDVSHLTLPEKRETINLI